MTTLIKIPLFEVLIGLIILCLGAIFATTHLLKISLEPFSDHQQPTETLFYFNQPIVLEKNRDFPFWLQPISAFGIGHWDQGNHLFAQNTQVNDWVRFQLSVPISGQYKLQVYLTRANDYGVVTFFLNGQKINKKIDLWAEDGVIRPTGAIDLGVYPLKTMNKFTIQVISHHPNNHAPHYQFAIDKIILEKL
jgi:hypothetical protein